MSFFGFLDAAWGIGAILGSALAGFVIKRLGTQTALWLSTVAVGAAILLYSRQTTLLPALIVLAGFGFPNAVANVAPATDVGSHATGLGWASILNV